MNKLKVVFLCQYRNNDIISEVNPTKFKGELSPWIFDFISIFKKYDGIELHIVSPHTWIPTKKEFVKENIYYHFFNPGIPMIGIPWPKHIPIDRKSGYFLNKIAIKKIIKKINPDIINLFGAEISYYSSSIFQFISKYPIIVTIQGFINKSEQYDKITKHRKKNEVQILKNINHYAVSTNDDIDYISKYNQNTSCYKINYPTFSNYMKYHDFEKRKYDIIYFARIQKEKGIEDLLKSAQILKENNISLKVIVIGLVNNNYLTYLKKLAKDYNIFEMVSFIGFVDKKNKVHEYVAKSKITVLPTYFDVLPGTIRESLLLKTPVIAYDVGGINELNKIRESVILVEKFDIKELSIKIKKLLQEREVWNYYSNNGYKTMCERSDTQLIYSKFLDAYKKVISKFQTK